ncbi:hypothetical protein N7493_002338 [Penicillium malachiteum]|uniref:Uncharacterized protein n=1 Tax=Penicillium malachiteum TaxID=1324776 RepID=A0AAD6HRP0_9EURO|nr:hypothetical protein N7493_002338 [Penicillium malachiteum]
MGGVPALDLAPTIRSGTLCTGAYAENSLNGPYLQDEINITIGSIYTGFEPWSHGDDFRQVNWYFNPSLFQGAEFPTSY